MKRTAGLLLLLILGVTTFTGFNSISNTTAARANSVERGNSLNKLTRLNFEDSLQSLYTSIGLEKAGLSYEVFRLGMVGYYSLQHDGKISDRQLISFIDFSKKSTEKRFYTVDLKKRQLLFHSLVSHGKNTGENEARQFSNTPQSNQSSLGFYVTGESYIGSKGFSLRLDGQDPGFNDKMRERAVVMHDADYVSEAWIKKYGRLGRSQGCPALPKGIAPTVIKTIKDKTVIFAYYNDPGFLAASSHLNLTRLFDKLDLVESALAVVQ
jgi:hypothetical protein